MGNCSPQEIKTDFGCLPVDPNNPLTFAATIYGVGLGLIGGVALIFIIYGGYLILSSKGDPQELSRGRSYIISAIAGVILALSGFALYQIIAKDFVKLPGF